jgi:hypothetical protein
MCPACPAPRFSVFAGCARENKDLIGLQIDNTPWRSMSAQSTQLKWTRVLGPVA